MASRRRQLSTPLGEPGPASARPFPIGGPPPPHQVAMPPKHRLGSNQDGCPGRPGESLTQSREDHAIRRAPSDPLDLSLQHLNLSPQDQHLRLELGLLLPAGDSYVQHEADQRIEHSSGHGEDRSNAVKPARTASGSAVF